MNPRSRLVRKRGFELFVVRGGVGVRVLPGFAPRHGPDRATAMGNAIASRMMTGYDDVMRTIVDLPEDQLAALDAWREARGVSRAEAVRRAVAKLLDTDDAREQALDAAWGLWKARAVDGLTAQERLRGEWDDR